MYEPVTVAKVRKETKITVPAGGWVLIGQPDEPLHIQIARRSKIVNAGNVNDDYEKILIGRMQLSSPPTVFVSKEQAKAQEKAFETNEKTLTDSHKDALNRQKKQAEESQKERDQAHAEKLKEINAQNDATRNRGQ